jgi:putative hemolysin
MLELIIILICLALNAILAASEIAFVSINKKILRQLSRTFPKRTQYLVKLHDQPERTLSVIQLGITLMGLIAGAVGGAGVEESVRPWIQGKLNVDPTSAELISILLLVLPLTALTVVFGELVPKAVALRMPFNIASATSRWLIIMDKIFYPVISAFEWATKSLASWLGIMLGKQRGTAMAPAATAGEEQITKHQEQYILNLINIETKSIQDIYCPWEDIIVVEQDDGAEAVLEIAIESGHTRLPVCQKGKVVGLINTKEIMAFASQGAKDWTLLLRPILRVRGEDSLIRVLKMMQEKRSHLAVVEGGEGNAIGIVTLEDIFEEIVGDIADEDDERVVERLLAQRGILKRWAGPKTRG